MIREDAIYGAPDVVFEILSPGTSYYNTKKKFRNYEKNQVKEYWLIDHEDGESIGYTLEKDKFTEFFRDFYPFHSQVLNIEISFEDE